MTASETTLTSCEEFDARRISAVDLLVLHGKILEELRRREILRSFNNPTGDLAEYIFCRAFGWTRHDNAHANVDAIDSTSGARYQIKARRITDTNPSRQLSALRELSGGHFDFLAGLLFSPDYSVRRAAIIPYELVLARATPVIRTNSHRFLLHDSIWNDPTVRDVTDLLRCVSL